MEETKKDAPVEIKKPITDKKVKKVSPVILKNTLGKEVKAEDYFYAEEGAEAEAPAGFIGSCGLPVDREDLIEIFNKVFKPEDGVLFYKARDKEVYIVIIPLKYSSSVSHENGSVTGDFQKHAISFLNEGSVNPDTLKMKLKRIIPFVKYSDR